MTNKLILFLILISYLGLSSCGKKTKPVVSYFNDLKEESRTQAKDGSYIYSHFLNVDIVKLYNERKIKKTDVVAELKLHHLEGFKRLVENAPQVAYHLFAGDSSETVYTQRDSALMVLAGFSATITDARGNKVVVVKDKFIPTQAGTTKFPNVTDTTNLNGNCIEVKENVTLKINNESNIYYKNLNVLIINNPEVFKKEQNYKLHFRVYDKVDPNRYLEGETLFKAY